MEPEETDRMEPEETDRMDSEETDRMEPEETDDFRIRPAVLKDLLDIHRLEQECFATPWSLQSLKTDLTENAQVASYLVASDHGKIAGYIGMWQVLDEAQITNLAVAKEFRGRGIGKSLIRRLCLLAKEKGIVHLTLEVRPSNSPARRIYESTGFVEVSKRKAYYQDNGEDAIIMLKNVLTNAD